MGLLDDAADLPRDRATEPLLRAPRPSTRHLRPDQFTVTLAVSLDLVLVGYTLIFMGVNGLSVREAFTLSGSSLFTLGFAHPSALPATILVFTEAAIGLFLLAFLITYLPAIYSAYARREVGVTALEVRAGSPPSAREMVWRHWTLERMGELGAVWQEWERWYVDVEESHTSLPSLVFFPIPAARPRWVTAAGAVLDSAALILSTVDIPRDVQAEFCSGPATYACAGSPGSSRFRSIPIRRPTIRPPCHVRNGRRRSMSSSETGCH